MAVQLPPQQSRLGNFFNGLLAVCLREDDTIEEAAGFFLQFGIPATPVLDAEGALAVIISEKDLLATMVSSECRQRPLSSTMCSKVIRYEEDTPVHVIYEFLCRVSVRGVVITNQGRPTGMITHGSLLRWFHGWIGDKRLMSGPQTAHSDLQTALPSGGNATVASGG